jgi:uncharacterized membrane protein YgaE (UPF0421/DUF939 family)
MNQQHTELILKQVFIEREKQFSKWGEQNLPIIDDMHKKEAIRYVDEYKELCDTWHEKGLLTFHNILQEEYYEAFSESDIDKQREEFIQVAAVAVQIIEYIDRMESKK